MTRKTRGKRPSFNGLVAPGLMGALLLLVICAPGVLAILGRAPATDHSTKGYTRLINGVVAARHWLVVDYDHQPVPRIKFADDALAGRPDLQKFVRSSYLQRDMETADPNVWTFDSEGERVEAINPSAHNVIGPFSDISAWTGDLFFSDRGVSAPTVMGADGSRYTLSLAGATGGWDGRVRKVQVFRSTPVKAMTPSLSFWIGGEQIATALLVGDQVILRVNPSDAKVRLGSREIVQTPSLRVWRRGESLILSQGDHQARYVMAATSPAISAAQAGRLRTRYPGLENFASGVEASMNDKDGDTPVYSTLNSGLQMAAQTALENGAEQLRQGGDSFPAALLMMDAKTGEILAAASYPSRAEHLPLHDRRSVQPPSILTHNQNFVRLPIGSVAKAPISLAILAADSDLASLRVRPSPEIKDNGKPHRPFESVLGVDLGGTFDDHVGPEADGYIGFETFLAKSSNKYAVALMLMGLGETSTDVTRHLDEPYMLNGQLRDQSPRLPIRDGGVQDTGYTFWKIKLQSLFDVAADGDLAGRAPPYDNLRIWGDLAKHRRPAFESVSPARENFGLNEIHHLGPDYLMTILGGNRSRWTTVKVAEVFSRIVTRTPVTAHVVKTAPPLSATAPRGGDFVADSAWFPVMNGLRGVATYGGTAASLSTVRLDLPAGEMRIFAKTGTPTLERYETRQPRNEALQAFVLKRCGLIYEPGGLRLAFAPQARTSDQIVAALSRQAPRCAGRSTEIAQEIVRLNGVNSRQGGLGARLLLSGREVINVPENPLVRTGAGHVIAVVVGIYGKPNDLNDQPLRALTIVVNMQNRRDNNTAPARDAVIAALKDSAVQAWLKDGAPQPVADQASSTTLAKATPRG